MQALLARETPPDHIVIETSGLALPQPLVRAFAWPTLKPRVTVDGVVTLLDGPAVVAGTFAADTAAVDMQRAADDGLDHETPLSELYDDQVACADMIVVNKADLMEDPSRGVPRPPARGSPPGRPGVARDDGGAAGGRAARARHGPPRRPLGAPRTPSPPPSRRMTTRPRHDHITITATTPSRASPSRPPRSPTPRPMRRMSPT